MVASLDDSVGRIIDKLKQVGQSENTLIVFLSDDGWAAHIGDGVCPMHSIGDHEEESNCSNWASLRTI